MPGTRATSAAPQVSAPHTLAGVSQGSRAQRPPTQRCPRGQKRSSGQRWPVSGGEQIVAIELKVWRDKQADPIHEGLGQLERYLRRLGLQSGFLVIFDRRRSAEEVPWEERPRWESAALAGGEQVRVLRL